MKYYSQHKTFNLFDLQSSLSGLSKDNRWVKLADNFPWAQAELEYNKLLKNRHRGAGNKPARLVVGAFIVKHVESLSDEKTITAIQETPYMQYLVGLDVFTNKPIFSPELFVHLRKRLSEDFFNKITLMLQQALSPSSPDDSSNSAGQGNSSDTQSASQKLKGTLKIDATCCDAEVRFPTDTNLLEDGSKLLDRLLTKFCAKNKIKKPSNHRSESRSAYVLLIKKKHKGKRLINKTKLCQLKCFQTDFVHFINYIVRFSSSCISCFTKRDIAWLQAAKTMYEQQKMMYDEKTHRCANRIISIFNHTYVLLVVAKLNPRLNLEQRLEPVLLMALPTLTIIAGRLIMRALIF